MWIVTIKNFIYLSSSWIVESRSNLYWNPEQPPPSTVTLKQAPFSDISFKRLTQLSLIIRESSDVFTAALTEELRCIERGIFILGGLEK